VLVCQRFVTVFVEGAMNRMTLTWQRRNSCSVSRRISRYTSSMWVLLVTGCYAIHAVGRPQPSPLIQ